jgi:hypothetical protein
MEKAWLGDAFLSRDSQLEELGEKWEMHFIPSDM